MPRRFVIADNALQTMVGHFYEYDVSVMANLPDGFDGLIVSNVDAPAELHGCTVPFFQCGFWSLSTNRRGAARAAATASPDAGQASPAPAGGAVETKAAAPTLLDRLKFLGKRLEQQHADRWWARGVLRLGKPLYYAYRARQWRKGLDVPALEAGAPTAAPAPTLQPGDQVLRDVFLKDLQDLLAEYHLGPEDVLFFPNMNHWAFAAVLDVLETWPDRAGLPQMKLLFRRNVFRGRPTHEQYLSNDYVIALFRYLFGRLEALDADRVSFFTDTRRLKDEYEVFSPRVFHVLPIPFRHDFIEQKLRPGHPLSIVYLGNARSEKGFQHIPALVSRLRSRIERGEVRFVLQAVPDPEPVVLDAIATLRREGLVTLLESPLSDQEYYGLINEADLLLILYDPIQYYSRSSCIFVESMVSGTPFLTMAGSWMADTMTPGTGEVAPGVADLPDRMERLVDNYPAYFEACRRAGHEWREFHNARRLVEILLNGPHDGRAAA